MWPKDVLFSNDAMKYENKGHSSVGDASSKKRYQILNLPNQEIIKKAMMKKMRALFNDHTCTLFEGCSLSNNFNTDVSFKYGDN